MHWRAAQGFTAPSIVFHLTQPEHSPPVPGQRENVYLRATQNVAVEDDFSSIEKQNVTSRTKRAEELGVAEETALCLCLMISNPSCPLIAESGWPWVSACQKNPAINCSRNEKLF